jgi:hypothetical protein
MAGAGYKLFQTGDVLTAAQVNTYLNEQTVMVFANAAARTSALTSVLAEGMVSYLQDTNAVEVYNGSAWVGVSGAGDITEVQAGVGISVASGTGPIPVITNSSTDLITTAGDLLYGTAADTVARLGIGTAGQVLKVNSGATAPEWGAAGGAAGLTLIKTQTFGNAVTSVAVTSVFSSAYDNYLILISGGVMSASLNLQLQLGSTTSGYKENTWYFSPTSNTFNGDGNNAASNIRYAATGSTDSMSGLVYLFGPNLAKATAYKADAMRAVNNVTNVITWGSEQSNTQHTGFTLLVDGGGNITGGTVKIYGFANS